MIKIHLLINLLVVMIKIYVLKNAITFDYQLI